MLSRILPLTNWKFIDSSPDSDMHKPFSQPGLDTLKWYILSLPGDVNAALVRDGRMPDPHMGDNARLCMWVSGRDWWLRSEFQSPSAPTPQISGQNCCPDHKKFSGIPNHELVLDGIDGHADVYLNGVHLGLMKNAFRPHRFDVTEILSKDGTANVILLRFHSIDKVLGQKRADELAGWMNLRVLMRKPQYNFGWDWTLPLPSVGVINGIYLEANLGPRLIDCSVNGLSSGRVDFKFRANVFAREHGYELRIRVFGQGVSLEKTISRHWRCMLHASIAIDNPKLWWPNGLGEQNLYNWQCDLIVGGLVIDSRSGRVGLREVRILEEPFTEDAGPGISFWIEVNGRRVFCNGGNWIPTEIWPAQSTEDQYRFHLQKTAEANFNMLRVWGGGIYEREIFYDLCDEYGIMVWQDFMFASAGYPADMLRAEITLEAEYQIKRLRSHPCIVLWCGCNEDVYSWNLPDEKTENNASSDTGVYSSESGSLKVNRLRDDPMIYTMILRGLVSKHGLGVPYTESSPQSYEDAGNMPESGNCHISSWKFALFETNKNYDQWRRHFEKTCSFDSEFCIQGPSAVATMKAFLPSGHQWPPDDIWTFHIQRGHVNLPHWEQTLMVAGATFGEIDSLQKYVKHGQATHAEQMRAEFESARRDRPNNGGTMMWMLNDCWPTANWSIIDYYRRPKPSYYAAKRVSAALLPIIFERSGKVEFFFSNDGPAACTAKIIYGQERLDGTEVWSKETKVKTSQVDTVKFDAIEKTSMQFQEGDYLFIDARISSKALPRVTYFPLMWKNVQWPNPRIRLKMLEQKQEKGEWVSKIQVSTSAYARFCHLIMPDSAGMSWPDDNFFDLCAGDRHTVSIRSDKPFEISDIKIGHWLTDWP